MNIQQLIKKPGLHFSVFSAPDRFHGGETQELHVFVPLLLIWLDLVSRCNLGTKECCLTYLRPVFITHVGGVYLYSTLIGF